MLVHPTQKVLSSATLSNEIFCVHFRSKIILLICVPSTAVKWVSFCNHRNRKGVGGKNNVLVHYVNVSAPDPTGVVLCNPFKWDILYSFLIKNHVVVCFVPSTPAKCISLLNHKNRKFVGGKHNILILCVNASAPNSSGVVLCNPFKWDILYSFLIKNHVVLFLCIPHQQNEYLSATTTTEKF